MTELSIVIVSWNAKKYLGECLASLRSVSRNLSIETIVIDNGSTDGSPQLVRDQFPEVKVIENGCNLGFARGNNIGIKLATGKHICLINSDVNVPADCLPKMYQFMEQNPDIGLLGPQMLASDRHVARSGMRFPTVWNAFVRAFAVDSMLKPYGVFGNLLMTDFGFDKNKDMDVLNGWFWMVRREAVDEVGLLDERFFMYCEDIDWCKRFHLAGWRVVFYSEAAAVHYGGASSSNHPIRFSVEMQRASVTYWTKYHGRVSLVFYLVAIGLNHAIRVIVWGLMYLIKPGARSEALFALKRSAACLHYLMTLAVFDKAGPEVTV